MLNPNMCSRNCKFGKKCDTFQEQTQWNVEAKGRPQWIEKQVEEEMRKTWSSEAYFKETSQRIKDLHAQRKL